MKNKALLISISVMLSLSIILTGCGGKKVDSDQKVSSQKSVEDQNVNPPGQYPIVKDKITLTIGTPQNSLVKDFDTNEFTKWLEQKTNIDLKFELLPETDSLAKLQVMVAGGSDLPDVLMIALSPLNVESFASQKVLVPLNNYYENYGTNIKPMLAKAENKNIKKLLTMSDGNIYAIPKYAEQIGNNYSMRAWINKTWLDKLGLKMPATTDEFYEVLKAFKTMDPNGNGKADEIPLIGSTTGWRQQPYNFLFNAFLYNDTGERYIVNNGKIDVAFNKKEWQDGLKYTSRLCSEKLYSTLSFTQDAKQLNQIAGAAGPSTIGVFTGGSAAVIFPANDKRIGEYAPLPPLKGPAGVQWATYYPQPPTQNWVITKYCKNPLAAFRLGDLMLSEESAMRSRWGVPEVDWKTPAPGEKGMYEALGIKAKLKPILQWGTVQNSHWQEVNPTFRDYSFADGQVSDGNPLVGEYTISLSVPLYMNKSPKEVVSDLTFTPDEASEIATLRTNIDTYVNEYIARFITGDKNPEMDWNTYLKEFDNLGLKRYLEITQKAYDRLYKK